MMSKDWLNTNEEWLAESIKCLNTNEEWLAESIKMCDRPSLTSHALLELSLLSRWVLPMTPLISEPLGLLLRCNYIQSSKNQGEGAPVTSFDFQISDGKLCLERARSRVQREIVR